MNTKTSLFIGIIIGVMISLVLTAFGIWPKQHVSYEDAKLTVMKYDAYTAMYETPSLGIKWAGGYEDSFALRKEIPSSSIWWETIYIANEKYYVVSNGSDIEVIKP